MNSLILGMTSATPSASAVNYNYPLASMPGSWNATESAVSGVVAAPGTISKLYVKLQSAPTSGKSLTFTLYKNGSATGLTATVSDAATAGSDLSHSVSVAAGDLLSMQCTPSGTPTVSRVSWGVKFVGTNTAEFAIHGQAISPQPNTSTQRYYAAVGGNNATTATRVARWNCLLATTITSLYAKATVAPGSTKSWAISIYRNGAIENSSTITLSDPNTAVSITGLSIAVSAGDDISVSITPSGTPSTTSFTWSMAMTSSVDGQSVVGMSSANGASIGGSTSGQIHGSNPGGWSGESSNNLPIPVAATFSNLTIIATTSPSPGSFTFTFSKNQGAGGGNQAALQTTATGSDLTHSDTVAAGDTVDIWVTKTGSPTVGGNTTVSMIVQIAADVITTGGPVVGSAIVNAEGIVGSPIVRAA